MFARLFKRGLAALGFFSLAIAPSAPATARSNVGPALWEVKDKDTTVYLFGTIHLLPKDSRWRTPKFDKALQNSQSLVVETLIDTSNPQQLAGVMTALGFSSGLPPIAERVPVAKRPQLEAAIAKTRIPRAMFDRMETWAASFTLLGVQFQMLGVEGEQGVESVLRRSFAAAGKPVSQLETNHEQLSFFDRLPESAQRQLLEGALEDPQAMRTQFDGMLKAWMTGDVDRIGQTFNRDLSGSPELKAALLTRRNWNWSQWIERRMGQPGSVMVAVGAGHLAGEESVQRYLQSRGYKVRRLQ
ncbi:MAG TPA: TraB/GumN family protein [Sphingomicrobium sp.]|nr:TraB/GumN family protein [Sphingomicrobium sp.]